MKAKKTNKVDVNYYENNDFSQLIQSSKQKQVVHSKLKRITINISNEIYKEAQELDIYMNMGYQNVLKTAILLGINNLEKYIIEKKYFQKKINRKEVKNNKNKTTVAA